MTKASLLRAFVALILPLTVAGCAADVHSDRAQTCRIAAVAVFDPMPLRVVGQSTILSGDGGLSGVEIRLQSRDDGSLHRIECLFALPRGAAASDLAEIRTETETLSDSRLFMVRRFWLDTVEGAEADPGLAERGQGLPVVPFQIAYVLQSLVAALPNAAVYALLAATYSLVYGLFGRINLAFGDIAAIGGVAALLGAALALSTPPMLILVAGCGFGLWAAGLHGAVIERLVMWPLRRSTGQQGLVATIGLALFVQEYLRLISGNQTRYIPSLLSNPIGFIRAETFVVTVTPLSLIVFTMAIAASLGVLAILRFTGFGRDWRATSDDPLAAALFGVDPRRLSLQTFALACGLAGLAGASVTLISGTVGLVYTTTLGLKALIAAIVGGIGSVPGAFMGGLAIALIEALWSAYFPIVYRDLVIDVLLVAMLVLRPGGLFGYRDLLPRRI